MAMATTTGTATGTGAFSRLRDDAKAAIHRMIEAAGGGEFPMLLCVVLRQLEMVLGASDDKQQSNGVVNSPVGVGSGTGMGIGACLGMEMGAMFSSLVTPWVMRHHCLKMTERFYIPYPAQKHVASSKGVSEGVVSMSMSAHSLSTPLNPGTSPSPSPGTGASPGPRSTPSPGTDASSTPGPGPSSGTLDQLALLSSCVSFVPIDDPRCSGRHPPPDAVRAYVHYLRSCLR